MKNMKRAASLLLALVMVLCMAIPAYAVNSDETPNQVAHTITITNAESRDLGKYEAYQIFRGDISGNALTNITWGSGITAGENLTKALKEDKDIGAEMTTAIDGAVEANMTEAEAVAKALVAFGDNSDKLDAFASVVAKFLSDTKATNDKVATEVEVIGDGYYLLQYVGVPAQGDAYTKYILAVVKDVPLAAKKDAPTSEKFIVVEDAEVKASNASVGDVVEFKLKTSIPAMDGYDKYYYIVHDQLGEGLTFNDDVTIKLGKTELEAYEEGDQYGDYDYVVNVDGQKVEIVFCNFIQYKGQTGQFIITYSATLDEDAVITEAGNLNTAWLEYSNDPNYDHEDEEDIPDPSNPTDPSDPTDPTNPGDTPDDPDGPDKPKGDDPTGTTPESVVTVYTTALKINKVDEKGETLTEAKFQIEGNPSEVYMINEQIFEKSTEGTYYRLKNGTYTKEAPTEATAAKYDGDEKYALIEKVTETTQGNTKLVAEGWVNNNGEITFTRLGEGTYTITELFAPAGYNLLKEPITVTITWNGASAPEGVTDWSMWSVAVNTKTVDGKDKEIPVSAANNMFSINVVNQAGVQLPSTGGMGTTIFYIVGGLMVLAAIVLLVTKRRMNNAA